MTKPYNWCFKLDNVPSTLLGCNRPSVVSSDYNHLCIRYSLSLFFNNLFSFRYICCSSDSNWDYIRAMEILKCYCDYYGECEGFNVTDGKEIIAFQYLHL